MLVAVNLLFILTIIIFFVGLAGLAFTHRNKFFVILSIEAMFLSINLNFLMFSTFIDSVEGLAFIFVIIIVSAVEVVILLSFLILYFKRMNLFDLEASFKNVKY